MPDRYFKLKDHVGLDGDGNPEPIVEIGVAVNVPTVVGSGKDREMVAVAKRVKVKPLPDTRIVKTDEPAIADGLMQSGMFAEIDPPAGEQRDPATERKTLIARAKELGIPAKGKTPALRAAVEAAEKAGAESESAPATEDEGTTGDEPTNPQEPVDETDSSTPQEA